MGAKNDHHSYVRGLLLALALSAVSLTVGAASTFPGFMAKVAGRGTTVGAASDGTLIVTKGSGLTAGGGWTNAGNYGVAPGAAGAVKIGGSGTIPVGGKYVPVEIGGSLTKEAIAGAVAGCATGGIVGCALGVGTPLAIAWMGLSGTRLNPQSGAPEGMPPGCTSTYCVRWRTERSPEGVYPYKTASAACTAAVAEWGAANAQYWLSRGGSATADGTCNGERRLKTDGPNDWSPVTFSIFSGQVPGSPTWEPVTPQEVKDALIGAGAPAPMMVPELEKAGVDWNKRWPGYDTDTADGKMGEPKLKGPTVIQSEKTSTTNPDGSVTTKQSSTPMTYSGSKVTAGNTTTTEVTKNPDGTTRSTTSTVTEAGTEGDKPKEETPTQCDKYPETLGCAELDTPTAEIPKENKTVTFQAEDVLGGGACPANVTASFSTLGGQSATIVDWQTFCGMALPLRGLVIALASIMAFFIIMPGGVRE